MAPADRTAAFLHPNLIQNTTRRNKARKTQLARLNNKEIFRDNVPPQVTHFSPPVKPSLSEM